MTATPFLPTMQGMTAGAGERADTTTPPPTTVGGAIRLPLVRGVWLLLCGAMVANGIVHDAMLVPALKRTAADVPSAVRCVGSARAGERPR